MASRRIALAPGADLDGFRHAVRALAAAAVPPGDVVWSEGGAQTLFGDPTEVAGPDVPPVALPRAIADLVRLVVCHRDPERYALLYAAIWRVLHGERDLLDRAHEPAVHRLCEMAKAVRRDLHKMHAFLRFRRLVAPAAAPERFVAWFEPSHHILAEGAKFFVERFRNMVWTIHTPEGTAHWDGTALRFGPPVPRHEALADGGAASDGFERGWRGYYASTFHPARTNLELMRGEMPKKYWRNMPEAQDIPALVREAPARVQAMIERAPAMPQKRNPAKAVAALADTEPKSLADLNRIIAAAEPLVRGATRAVLGEGPAGAAIAFVGEQPGDQEDVQGRPFVGPAGQIFDRALAEAGLDRGEAYITNAVKHFKFQRRGKKRIHQKPTMGEIKHYRWWLMKELQLVRPRIVVALGSTALTALAGKSLPLMRSRGPLQFDGMEGYVTVHPSYLLRLPDESEKRRAYDDFVADLRRIRRLSEAASTHA